MMDGPGPGGAGQVGGVEGKQSKQPTQRRMKGSEESCLKKDDLQSKARLGSYLSNA